MTDLVADTVKRGDREELRQLLKQVCAATGMGFAAVARVTEHQWIACQVEDKIEFGLNPGQELEIKQTICDEIRESGESIVFDDASDDIRWARHPVPVLYGFRSYCSFPVYLDDGSFFGTLCALDPEPRHISDEDMIALLGRYAKRAGHILSQS